MTPYEILGRYGTAIALVALIAFNLAVTPNFATLQTLNVNLTQVCTIVIVAVGMTLVIAISDSGLPASLPGKINSVPSSRGRHPSNLMISSDSGTRCGRPDFIRLPGMSHVLVAMSISAHVANRASPDLHAVKTTNSRHRAPMPSMARSISTNP